MTLATYADLQSRVSEWINWDDLDTQIPTFITLTEARFNREIRHWRMEKRATAEIDSRYTALPADMLEPIRMELEGDYRPLRLVSRHVLQEEREQAQDGAGTPCLYALTGGEIEVYPTPDETKNLEMVYFSTIDALSDSNTTNWILRDHPDAYLYGALMQSAPYLAEDARVATWAALYANAVQAINNNSNDGRFGGAKRKRLRTA